MCYYMSLFTTNSKPTEDEKTSAVARDSIKITDRDSILLVCDATKLNKN